MKFEQILLPLAFSSLHPPFLEIKETLNLLTLSYLSIEVCFQTKLCIASTFSMVK